MDLKYGHNKIFIKFPPDLEVDLLQTGKTKPLEDPEKSILESLHSPVASAPLRDIVSSGESVCILVNDSTRLARSEVFLPLLIDELCLAGIREKDIFIVFANGSHRNMDEKEMRALVGEKTASRVALYNHDSKDEESLVFKGETSFGTPVYINKMVAAADRRILTGSVVHHFFAGFGGGRKALVPGVAGWETIRKNHSLLLDDRACTGALEGNPVHEDLLEAAQHVGADFLLNTVLDEDKNIIGVFAGDMIEAHQAACEMVDRVNGVKIDRLYDVVIASAGGYPKDINLYQAHKALDNALEALKPGGRMILLAQCSEGVGSAIFEEWAVKFNAFREMEEALRREFVLGGHKAYTVAKLLQKGSVYLVSGLDRQFAAQVGFIPVSSLDEALEEIYGDGEKPSTCVIPQGALVLPRLVAG
jgi:nickel-dependent lactate racemase